MMMNVCIHVGLDVYTDNVAVGDASHSTVQHKTQRDIKVTTAISNKGVVLASGAAGVGWSRDQCTSVHGVT